MVTNADNSFTCHPDADLLRAYRETEYRVAAEPPFTLHIGEVCPALARLQQAHGVSCSAFLTACNPASQLLDAKMNGARQAQLADLITAQGWRFLPGEGAHPSNGWPPEASFLVLGLPLEAAQALGRMFGQNAIVWSGPDTKPELVMLF